MSDERIGITGVGSALPDAVLTTGELQARVARESGLRLPAGLFESVTGIRQRRIAREDEYASTLAIAAGQRALDNAGLAAPDIDLLLFASATRDFVEPATAHVVQMALETRAHCLDVTNACNSFLNGIDIAKAMIQAGRAHRVLVVTGETPTRSMRWQIDGAADVRKFMAGWTFGDAGAAVVVERVGSGGITYTDSDTHSQYWDIGGIFGGGSRYPRGDEHTYFSGDGSQLREVFEKVGAEIFERMWARTELGWDDIAHVLVHQVTLPYIDRFVEVTGAPRERLKLTVPEHGNMASATLGLQLDLVRPDLRPGDRILLAGLAGGISLMVMLVEWT